jgi:hypothetical protein
VAGIATTSSAVAQGLADDTPAIPNSSSITY